MSDAKDQHEPSMEEILASIRRIISEDGDAGAADAQGEASGSAAPPSDDVLVLTDEVQDEDQEPKAAEEAPTPSAPEPVEEPAPAPAPEPVAAAEPEPQPEAEAAPQLEAEPEPQPAAEPAPQPAPAPAQAAATPEFGRRIISDTTATASLAALSELVNRAHREPAVASMPLGQSQRTLEELTRELLTPMLKSWLDANLPQLVERIVREEIGRLALDAQRR